jgi:predicted transposase/invertase (TIGR01784 family)
MTQKDILIPDLLPPSEDGVFKTLLTHPKAKPVLRDIISSILGINVTEVTVTNTEFPITFIDEKRERLDVNCVVDDNTQIDVEMQANPMEGDSASKHANLRNRAIYYACDLHASQEGRGIAYGMLKQSYQITFCDFAVFPERTGFINRFSFRDSSGFELSDAVGIVFVELSKLNAKVIGSLEEMSVAEMWALFFGHANKPEFKETLDKLVSLREEIKMANELLTNISQDEIERAHYRSRKMFRMDMEHNYAVLRDEIVKGREEGRVEGRVEGREEGRAESLASVAQRMAAKGFSIDQIVAATGMSKEQLHDLPGMYY